jgi:dTDP-4-amino-4,6-dideoxygalactose transaminase
MKTSKYLVQKSVLAINGGKQVRKKPMPPRFALGKTEEVMITKCIAYYRDLELDPGYQGHFEEQYCNDFQDLMGGGYADVVATGTAALYIALAALNLPKGSEVLVSPITDPGTISAIIMNELKPKLMDSMHDSYNIGPEQMVSRIGPKTKAAVIVHTVGQAAPIESIVKDAHKFGLKVVEDCSQAHGASWKGRKVGSFGDIAAFSTMYRKAHITGASGGVVYSKNEAFSRMALAYADRGKPRWQADFDDRDPSNYLFPALNFNTDEISCAIGIASLKRLSDTIKARLNFVNLVKELIKNSHVCKAYPSTNSDSPFIYPIFVETTKLHTDKINFAKALIAEGIPLNPHYMYLVRDWNWVKNYLADDFETANARKVRNSTFCLFLNENYGPVEAKNVYEALVKVENALMK